MKTNELMVGDWVSFNDEPVKVGAINVLGDVLLGEHTHQASEEGIHPIPITDEILNLNYTLSSDTWRLGSAYSDNYIFNGNGKYTLSIQLVYTSIINHFPLHYVHELQHLLRACDLHDLADNFKIE